MNEFDKVSGHKINTQKSVSFLYTHLLLKQKKYLGINLNKEVKDLYSENYRTLKKEIKEDAK